MKLKIEMNLDNAAFEDGGTDEAKRAINAALERIRGEWATNDCRTYINDSNGNKVGKAEVVP